MIPIHTLKNQIEAQVIEEALREAGIKYVIRTFEDTAYNGIFVPQKGYGQVFVEEGDRQGAEKVIETCLLWLQVIKKGPPKNRGPYFDALLLVGVVVSQILNK